MNLNDEEEDFVFNQHCLELAKLLRTEQTEDFLQLYDSLPSEWNGSRVSNRSLSFIDFFVDSISKYLMRNNIYSLKQPKNIFVNYKNSTKINFKFNINVHFKIEQILCQIYLNNQQ
jgi:hypothetical protein